MQIAVLAAFILVLTLLETPGAIVPEPAWLFASAVGAYLLVSAALGRLGAVLTMRALRAEAGVSRSAVRWYGLLGMGQRVWMVGGIGAVAAWGYGHWVMAGLGLGRLPLVGTLAVVAPMIAALVLHWLLDYPVQREFRRRLAQVGVVPAGPPGAAAAEPPQAWTRGQYLLFCLRQDLLMIGVPLCLILLLRESLVLYVQPLLPKAWGEDATAAASLVAAAAVLVVTPSLIVRIWGARRLPEGALRDLLLDIRRRVGVTYRQVMIWPTGRNVANAAVLGLVGPFRYVLLSDALLQYFDERSVVAVYFHEVKHIQARHLPYFMLALPSLAAVCGICGQWLARAAGGGDTASELAALGLLVLVGGLVFGWVSRRFERQCDVFSAWMMSPPAADPDASSMGPGGPRVITPEGAQTFSWALQRIALMNGGSPTRRSWRHGSIASRVEHLRRIAAAGSTPEPIDRLVRRIKLGIWLAFAAAVALGVLDYCLQGTAQ